MSNKYTPENIFDMLMDYIDECILNQMSTKDICKSMMENTGIFSSDFNVTLKILNFTYPSLAKYIPARRAYLALDHTINNPTQSMQSIANFFGYEEASMFSREIKKHFNITPTEARKQTLAIKDNRLSITNRDEETQLENNTKEKKNMDEYIYEELKENRISYYMDLIESINDTENIFDGNAIHLILQLADMYDVSARDLGVAIYDAIYELKRLQEFSPKIEHCIDLGITSSDELNEICEFYGCKYYELNSFLVDYYRKTFKE